MADVPTYAQNTVVTSPDPTTDEVQKWTLSGVGAAKKWTIELDGEKAATAAIVGNVTAANLQTELEKLSNVNKGDLTVSGSGGGPFTVTYSATGRFANINVPTPIFTAEEGSVANEDVTVGGSATTAVQRGTGNADRTGNKSPLSEESPVTYRAGHSGSY